MKLKNSIYIILFISLLTLLFTFSVNTTQSIHETIQLYISKVFPSLYLFVLFTSIIVSTDMLNILSNSFSFISKLFKLKKEASTAIILGYLCGFPSASSTIDKLYEDGLLSKKDCYHLLSFTNNASPVFIVSAVGTTILNSKDAGIKLLLIHIVSSIAIGIFYSFFHKDNYIIQENHINLKSKGVKLHKNMSKFDILKKSIIDSFKTMIFILAYMIIFNILADVINSYNIPGIRLFTATFELTKGINNFGDLKYIHYISFLLGFSSFSIIFQIKSSLKSLDYPTYKLILYKLLHGILSFGISFIIF